jgi:replication-associated recombination protein RarA
MQEPLAFALRPTALSQMVGQEHIRTTIKTFLES